MVEALERRPLLVVVVVALILRVGLAVGSFVVMDGPLVPDEGQYVALADAVANQQGAEAWFPGYGQSLYRSTYAFSAPLARLFEVAPANRLVGSLVSALFGTVTAAATYVLAREIVSRRAALIAGLVVAIVPSQVYWSSASLREAMVWALLALAGLAVGFGFTRDRRAMLLSLAVAGLVLLPMAWLRDQTFVAAVWSIVLAAVLVGRRDLLVRVGGALVVFVAAPAIGGLGPGGIDLISDTLPQLGSTRTYLSMSADTGITPTSVLRPPPESPTSVPSGGPTPPTRPSDGSSPSGPPTTTPGSVGTPGGGSPGGGSPGGGSSGEATPEASTTTTVLDDGHSAIVSYDGALLLVDETASASLRQLPRGVVASVARPFPWEGATSGGALLAKVENVLWFGLYLVAAVGAWAGRRRRAALAFPFVCGGALVVMSAVSQGNLGTAFRHRAQSLWALAVLAAVGLDRLLARRAQAQIVR